MTKSVTTPGHADLWRRLVDDAAMFPPGNASAREAVERHVGYRTGPLAQIVGPLVVADSNLAAVDREVGRTGAGPIEVSVINTSGAGGLVGLAGREFGDLAVVSVESVLPDLDDLAGNAGRLVRAAAEMPDQVQVFVELPYAAGWERAVEVVEAAGMLGKIRTGGTEPADYPSPAQLAEQLSVLVEADLAFKATAGLHHAWPNAGHNEQGIFLPQHGFLNVMIAVHALVGDADRAETASILTDDYADRLAEVVGSWDATDVAKVRRRFHSFGCCGVTDPINDLVTLGLTAREHAWFADHHDPFDPED